MNSRKLFKAIPLLLFLPTLLSFDFIPITQDDVEYGTETIGPFFEDDGLRTVSLSYTYNSSDFILEAREIVYIYKSEKIDANKRQVCYTNLHTLRKGNSYSYSFDFYPTNHFDDIRGAYFEFLVIDTKNGKEIDSKTVHLFLAYEDELNSEYIAKSNYVHSVSGTIACLSTIRLVSTTEIFNFQKFSFSIEDSPMGIIDTSKFVFTYSGPEFNYKDAYLVFQSSLRIFPEIGGPGMGMIEFPCSLRKVGSDVICDFSCNYVNPKTLAMSHVEKNGYVKAKNIYFAPQYYDDIQEEILMTLYVNQLGINKTSFRLNILYYPTINLVGDCNNSSYCIVGSSV